MKNLKFRAWDKEEREFVPYLHDIVLKHGETIEGIEYEMPHEGIVYNDISYFELLQSTGLKDVHDFEFFDKDIARDIDSEELGLVEYVNGAFVMKFAGGDGADLYDVKDNFEIIGNRYEHPHLLKE